MREECDAACSRDLGHEGRSKLGIQDLDVVLRTSKMSWFRHVECSTGWITEVRKLKVVVQKTSGRSRKSWDEVLDHRENLHEDKNAKMIAMKKVGLQYVICK